MASGLSAGRQRIWGWGLALFQKEIRYQYSGLTWCRSTAKSRWLETGLQYLNEVPSCQYLPIQMAKVLEKFGRGLGLGCISLHLRRHITLPKWGHPTRDGLFTKKRVFVGSSTEGKPLAEKVITALSNNGLSPLAWFDFFKSDRPPLQELEHLTLQTEGAVLIATPDDERIIRGRNWDQARENVLFECGLLAGSLGRAKCGLLVPDKPNFKIPSDFLGVACFEAYDTENAQEATATMIATLVKAITAPRREESVQSRSRRLLQFIGWIRDEAFRLVQDWDAEHGKEIVSERIVSVSAFVRDDIDSLELRPVYNDVEALNSLSISATFETSGCTLIALTPDVVAASTT